MKQVCRPKAATPKQWGGDVVRVPKADALRQKSRTALAMSPGNPSPHHLHPDRATIISFCRPPEESQHQPKLVPEIRECAR